MHPPAHAVATCTSSLQLSRETRLSTSSGS